MYVKLNDYLIDNEKATAKIGAFDDPDAVMDSSAGTLACTPYRLVYINGNDVTDISLKGVNSIKYRGEGYPKRYLGLGLGSLFVGLLVWFVRFSLEIGEMVPESVAWTFVGISVVTGLALLVQGHFMRRSSLKVYTPSKTYEFYSKEPGLDEIGHTVRGYEMKS
jgi:hypothetical protein